MTTLVYYMPGHLLHEAEATQRADLLDFCELFRIVNPNACVIDRTGSLTTPLDLKTLYPIPEFTTDVQDFGTLCLNRAEEILAEGKQIQLMYSGGLDSTCMLVAFNEVLRRQGKSREQVTISASIESQCENPYAWRELILPHFELVSARDTLAKLDLVHTRYVQGENADQLFGSDRVFNERYLLEAPFNKDTLRNFLVTQVSRTETLDRFQTELWTLASKCPLQLDYMRDFLWWLNFAVKWQSVALRTLSFTNVFEKGCSLGIGELKNFNTFFNTTGFQQLSMSGKLDRWGPIPSAYTYKQAARDFIAKHHDWPDYVRMKQKIGSLYNVIRQRTYVANAVGYKDGQLFPTTIS